VSKNKLAKFQELSDFERVFQPSFDETFKNDYYLRGKWSGEVFGNENPLVLELGCGKGEYTVGMAKKYKMKNFIGVDIKGARIWRGAKTANEENILNAAFLRTRIELINSFFAKDEVAEIWLTFPDPQEKKRRMKKRLSGPRFLNQYRNFLQHNGIIHLKTDNDILFDYTKRIAEFNDLQILFSSSDLYKSDFDNDILNIQTFYEKQFLGKNIPIKYIKFRLPADKLILDLPDDEE
jgi:tRNA (guanine-N7-)-methyltransferase